MIITCPNCATQFTIPDSALGETGRKLKCAKCGHKWHQSPPAGAQPAPAEPEPAPTPDSGPASAEPPGEGTAGLLPGFEMPNFSFDQSDGAKADDEDERDHDRESDHEPPKTGKAEDLDFDDLLGGDEARPEAVREPIPEALTARPVKSVEKKKGAAGLWALVALLVLLCLGAVAYVFQTDIIRLWPGSADIYAMTGLKRELVGEGLEFRSPSSERRVVNDSEALIVRGVIVNTTDQPKDMPLLRLSLVDGATVLQEQAFNPPKPVLEAGGTVTFRIIIDHPNPRATEFKLGFGQAVPAQPGQGS